MGITTATHRSGIDTALDSTMKWLQGQNLIKQQKLKDKQLEKAYGDAIDRFKNMPEDASISDINNTLYDVLGNSGQFMQELFPLAQNLRTGELAELKDRETKDATEEFGNLVKETIGPGFDYDLSKLDPDQIKAAYEMFKPKEKEIEDATGSYLITKTYNTKTKQFELDPSQTIRTGSSREQEIGLQFENSKKLAGLNHYYNMKEIEERGMYDLLKQNNSNSGSGTMSEEDLLKNAKASEDLLAKYKTEKQNSYNEIKTNRTELAKKFELMKSDGTYDQEDYEDKIGALRSQIKNNLVSDDDPKVVALRSIEAAQSEIKRLTLYESIFNPNSEFFKMDERVDNTGKKIYYNSNIKEVDKRNGVNVPTTEWNEAWSELEETLRQNPDLGPGLIVDGKVANPEVFRQAVHLSLLEQAASNPAGFLTKYKKILK